MADSEHAQLLELEAAALADIEQYGQCPLTDKARVQKLSLSIQDKLAKIRAVTRDLELLAEEVDSDEERQEVAAVLAQHKAEHERIQAAFKQAALSQRTAVLTRAKEERRELLLGADGGAKQRQLQTEADSVALAEDVTGGLRRTRQVLAEELEQTSATLAAMEQSHASLAKTQEEYQGQHRQLKRSKGLLGTLNWQAKSETYMLWMGLSLFLLVCAYIFQKRAGHFVPDSLKPTNLLGGMLGSGSGGGGATGGGSSRQPLAHPASRSRTRAPQPAARGGMPAHAPAHHHTHAPPKAPAEAPAPWLPEEELDVGAAEVEHVGGAVGPEGAPMPHEQQQQAAEAEAEAAGSSGGGGAASRQQEQERERREFDWEPAGRGEGAPGGDGHGDSRHIMLDPHGRRIAVDTAARFVRRRPQRPAGEGQEQGQVQEQEVEAAAAEEAEGSQQAQQAQQEQRQQVAHGGRVIIDPQGRRIAVDSAEDFVRVPAQQPAQPAEEVEGAGVEGAAADKAAADAATADGAAEQEQQAQEAAYEQMWREEEAEGAAAEAEVGAGEEMLYTLQAEEVEDGLEGDLSEGEVAADGEGQGQGQEQQVQEGEQPYEAVEPKGAPEPHDEL